MPDTVLLIHGAFCGGWCFADFVPALEVRGYHCRAPDLRYHVSGPALTPDPRLAAMSIADYTADMAALIAGMPEPPVVGAKYIPLIGTAILFAGWVAIRTIRQRRKAAAASATSPDEDTESPETADER